jgi:hypothetical protein
MHRVRRYVGWLFAVPSLTLALVIASANGRGMGFYHRDGRHLYIDGRHVFVRGEFYGRTVDRYVTFLGFQYASGTIGAERYRALAVPEWTIIALLALAASPVLYAARSRSHIARRRHAGLCEGCGYDLRASPDRCPECGAPPAAK